MGLLISSPPCFSSSVPPPVCQRFSFDVLERILLILIFESVSRSDEFIGVRGTGTTDIERVSLLLGKEKLWHPSAGAAFGACPR